MFFLDKGSQQNSLIKVTFNRETRSAFFKVASVHMLYLMRLDKVLLKVHSGEDKLPVLLRMCESESGEEEAVTLL